ncbi:hypothetical protein [Haliangium sp.]|uniref:hypothetical protein n=1 Tax=Haliangium sp. TaxID=2663208 RepID=UPI003D0FF2E3
MSSPLLRAARLALALVLTCAAAGPARAQLLSPGPLHRTHAGIDDDDHCSDCHTSGKQVEARKCLDCHSALGKRIQQRAGLHGRSYRGKACESCHVEHIGRASSLIRWPHGSERDLDHDLTGWRLEGKHRAADCAACHDKRTKSGTRTYLGLSAACGSCHDDAHQGRLGPTCQDCHVATGWRRVRLESFDHDRTAFALKGKHDQVECAKCHGDPPTYQLRHDTCERCHQDPHQGRFSQPCAQCHVETGWNRVDAIRRRHPGVRLVGGHKRVGCNKCHDRGTDRPPSKGRACAQCHEPVHLADFGTDCKDCHGAIEWLGLPERVGRRNHGRTRYPLRGKHAAVACARCHSPKAPPAQRFRELAFGRCDGCHQDQHRGSVDHRDGGECVPCHRVSGFRPTTFGPELHATTEFALDGRHLAVPCSGCHQGKRPRRDLGVKDKTCAGCHENPHGAQFEAEMRAGGCAHCHSTSSWHSPKVDHSLWPLTGAHAEAACTACHSPSPADEKAGRGATYRGAPRECGGCHYDVHAGQFNAEPARTCEACHDTRGFEITEFDHDRLARYPLTGAHERVECSSCHPTEPLANGDQAVRYRLGYRSCKACHANPH